jgi:hypothetical protein
MQPLTTPLAGNTLVDSGLPLFFELANPDEVGIAPPPLRRGDALTTWVRSLSAMQKEALVASRRSGRAWRLASDEGAYLNGHDAAPCPLAFLTAGMIASFMNEITALARRRGATIRGIELVQDNYYTMEGSMLKKTMVGGALPVELGVTIDCDLSRQAVLDLVRDAVTASPANGLIRGRLANRFTLSCNGASISTDRVPCLDGGAYPDPRDRFGRATPTPAPTDVITKGGETPHVEGDRLTSAPGSSLADSQSRVLRIGGICTLREDGLKEITQLQYSPRGTMWHFLSEESPADGGLGRAPDANTLISAGIGFCFMTQFGRFVTIMKRSLEEYRIVQDTHFSLGGASSGTGLPGTVDPIETHVFLKTSEDDAFAREVLDMSEQTCFLHALCRTDTEVKVRILEGS